MEVYFSCKSPATHNPFRLEHERAREIAYLLPVSSLDFLALLAHGRARAAFSQGHVGVFGDVLGVSYACCGSILN